MDELKVFLDNILDENKWEWEDEDNEDQRDE